MGKSSSIKISRLRNYVIISYLDNISMYVLLVFMRRRRKKVPAFCNLGNA